VARTLGSEGPVLVVPSVDCAGSVVVESLPESVVIESFVVSVVDDAVEPE
jgi:hypothetical protein